MKMPGLAILILLISLLPTAASAQTLNDYYDSSHPAEPNQVVCATLARVDERPRCFVSLDASAVLTPSTDDSGRLGAGTGAGTDTDGLVTGEFDRVELREILIETDASLTARDEAPPSAPRRVLVKMWWIGRAGSSRDQSVSGRDVVIGDLKLDPSGALAFELVEVPTQMSSLGFLFPRRDAALIFGGDSNSPAVKARLLAWTGDLLNSVLPELLKNSRYAPRPGARQP